MYGADLYHQAFCSFPNSMLRRGIKDDLLPVAGGLGVGTIVFVPLFQRILINKYLKGIPADSRAVRAEGTLEVKAVKPELVDKI